MLTDTQIKKAMPGEKPVRMYDERGLYLEVTTSGGKWWRLKYRFGGKEKLLSLGTYPDTTLKLARDKRDRARELLAAGVDPSEARKAEKASRSAAVENSFEAVAREWHATIHRAKVTAGHAERTLTRFEQDVFPWLTNRPIGEIEAPELLAVLRKIEARGAIETAHRAKDACGQVFRYGIATGRCERNPAADLRDALRPVPSRHLAAIVDPKEGGALLRDVMAYTGQPVTKAALQLSALLLLRPGELRQMEWAWVDLDTSTLTIPPEVMKRSKAEKVNGAPHVVPLAPQSVRILRELHLLTGHGRYCFPSMLTGERCMSENTVRSALRRMGYGNEDMTAHGFRAMARTMIAERLNVQAEVIEAQLGHAVGDALGRAYNRTTFLEQRRDMMNKWADYLDKLRDGAEVLPFKAA